MPIHERSYSGKFFRPRPEILQEPNDQLYLVVTPWGPRSAAKRTVEIIQDFFLSSLNDLEATTPFPTLSCLSPAENNLRTALYLANQGVYREDNRDEYTAGVEVFAACRLGPQLICAQVGQPIVYLNRRGLPLTPLSAPIDATLELSASHHFLNPLPQYLLGLEPSLNIHSFSFRLQPKDELLLLSRTLTPPEFYRDKEELRSSDSLTQILSQTDKDMPFWIGQITLENF